MNLLSSIIPSKFRDQIVAQLQILATKHKGSRLGAALNDISLFVQNYASKTPAKLAFMYAFSDFENEAVHMLTNIYLAVLEMRGFQTSTITKSQLEYINAMVLRVLKRAPAVYADYKAFCKNNAHLCSEPTEQLTLNNELMDAYFKQFASSSASITDPLTIDLMRMFTAHKLLEKNGAEYDFENMRYLLLLLMLKLHTVINITGFFAAIMSNNPDAGQCTAKLQELTHETWPKALKDAMAAVLPITRLGHDLMLKGDGSVLKDAKEVFSKLGVATSPTIEASTTSDAEIVRFSDTTLSRLTSGERASKNMRLS